jgi:hypothetical protein
VFPSLRSRCLIRSRIGVDRTGHEQSDDGANRETEPQRDGDYHGFHDRTVAASGERIVNGRFPSRPRSVGRHWIEAVRPPVAAGLASRT